MGNPCLSRQGERIQQTCFWVAVTEPKSSYYTGDTLLFPIHIPILVTVNLSSLTTIQDCLMLLAVL